MMHFISQWDPFPLLFLAFWGIFAIAWYAWVYIIKHNSNTPPSPPSLPLFGNLLCLDPQLHSYFTSLSQTYGPIFSLRLGTKHSIVVSSPSIARQVLKDHDITFANRSITITSRAAFYGGNDILWTPNGVCDGSNFKQSRGNEESPRGIGKCSGKRKRGRRVLYSQVIMLAIAVMKETLRLHPPVPLLAPHCPSETTAVGGYTIPKGSRVFFNVWTIHRDPSFWENPLHFDPSRFLDAQCDYGGNDFKFFFFLCEKRAKMPA